MKKTKYISLQDLQKNLPEVLEEVSKFDVEYIVMIDKEPKVKISSMLGKNGKQIIVEEKADKKLEEFID
ncbi:MAG: hypothetical protein PHS44_07445 [Candidatus Dojkabacteria bacterium]|nr:hypothetical protein [Candidatus Dojkabacteria bacterium]